MLRDLQRCLAANCPVELIYLDRFGRATKRTVRLREIDGDRVKAYCLTRRAPRVFVIDNILAVQPAANRRAAGF